MMTLEQTISSTKVEQLRERINDENYLYAAIQRIALVLSNELIDMSQGGGRYNERQGKRRR
jgi:hypothetical protein